jgi:hypothetical protein
VEETRTRHEQRLRQLENARKRTAEAQASLASLQAEEVCREAARSERLHASRIAHSRNADLAAIDAEAAQGSVSALRYRLDGKRSQAAHVARELQHARTALRVEEHAANLASSKALALGALLQQAEGASQTHRAEAMARMQAAHSAATASLQAMAALPGTADPDGEAQTVPPLPADEHHMSLLSRLQDASDEADRWRTAAEELRAQNQMMSDVVLVDLHPDAIEGQVAVGNSSLRAKISQMLPAAPTLPSLPTMSQRTHEELLGRLPDVQKWLASFSRLELSGMDASTSTASKKVAAGAALLGAGIGLAAAGPLTGTALAGAAGAAALAKAKGQRTVDAPGSLQQAPAAPAAETNGGDVAAARLDSAAAVQTEVQGASWSESGHEQPRSTPPAHAPARVGATSGRAAPPAPPVSHSLRLRVVIRPCSGAAVAIRLSWS